MGQNKDKLKARPAREPVKKEPVDWDNMPNPNPRYKGMTVLEIARALLRGRRSL